MKSSAKIGSMVRSLHKAPTYEQARHAILAYLIGEGWNVKGALKVPHATNRDGTVRLWFKPQAIWLSWSGPGTTHELGNARSLHLDIRAHTPQEVVADAIRWGDRLRDMRG